MTDLNKQYPVERNEDYAKNIIYIQSSEGHMIDFLLGLFVCLSVSPSLRFGQLLRYAGKRIVNIMKVYIERNNLQLE